ncbi:hypothetical protein BDZ94DRAFT_1179501, partial [Collybia nuda]
KSQKGVHVQAKFLTGGKAQEQHAVQTAESDETERKKEAASLCKATKLLEDQNCCHETGNSFVFTGSISSKNKSVLQDIASSLNLSIDGTKAILVQQIQDHFTAHLELKEDDCYIGLFGSWGH